jgi:hypothetical protein
MTSEEKQAFIEDLCNSLRDKVISDIPKMPNNWDGIELRWLLSERATSDFEDTTARKKEFNNTCLISAL